MVTIKDPHKTKVIFENCWHDAVCEIGEPASYAVDVKKIDYNEFIEGINNNRNNFIKDFVFSFYSGTVYIFTDAFRKEILKDYKKKVFEWSQKQEFSDPSSEDYPSDLITARDWHFEDHGYGYSSTYEMMHFFRWNDDPVGAYGLFNETYDLLYTINAMGVRKSATDKEFNLNEIIDRIEINHYPPVKGGIAFHSDPIDFTRFAFTVNLTQFGVDYKSGGFGVGLGGGKILQIDPLLEIGSMVGFLPKICHGVEIIDPYGSTDPSPTAGRWYTALAIINKKKTKDRVVTTPDLAYPTLREQINVFKNKNLS